MAGEQGCTAAALIEHTHAHECMHTPSLCRPAPAVCMPAGPT